MKVFVSLDDNLGMMFNKRRQSRDEVLIDDVIKSIRGNLYINSYSIKLFENKNVKYNVADNFFEVINDKDCFFVENIDISKNLDKIDTIVVYRWNRNYPSDVKFEVDFLSNNYKLIETYDFKGRSHEKITKEVWGK